MRALSSTIREYAWGSHTAIATLQRRPVPSELPEAELWMGAHPSAPSLMDVGPGAAGGDLVPLGEVIARDPVAMLGHDVATAYGGRLPYLLKVIAAAQPLSLQAHPDAEQAAAGYAAEEAAGLPRDAPGRNYVDPHHKPELLVAVEDFDALCGFRHPDETAPLLESFGVDALKPVIAALQAGSVPQRLRRAVETLVRWPAEERAGLVGAVAAAGRSLAGTPSSRGGLRTPYHTLAADLGSRYPGDVGVVLALLLNRVLIRPDEAIFMPPGNLHAYLNGVGVEIMAASDNVVRGGLTPKHVDAVELLKVLRYEVLDGPVVRPEEIASGVLAWRPPVREFALVSVAVDAGTGPRTAPGAGPRIIVCVRGEAYLRAGADALTLRSGESAFVSADEPAVAVRGDAVVFQASPG